MTTNATFSNITVSYGEYSYYTADGRTSEPVRASIRSNTPYIGGFIGYAMNCKLTNCQVADNPVTTYVKDSKNKDVYVEGSATIDVYNNEYLPTLTIDTIKSVVNDFEDLAKISAIILEFYQQPQCVGGFIGKLDSNTSYVRFNCFHDFKRSTRCLLKWWKTS